MKRPVRKQNKKAVHVHPHVKVKTHTVLPEIKNPAPIPIADLLRNAPMAEDLIRHGITTEYLARKLKRELSARETKSFSHSGIVIESKPKVAWDVRQRARQDAHRLMGHYPAEKHEITHGVKDMSDEQLDALIERLQQQKTKGEEGGE